MHYKVSFAKNDDGQIDDDVGNDDYDDDDDDDVNSSTSAASLSITKPIQYGCNTKVGRLRAIGHQIR